MFDDFGRGRKCGSRSSAIRFRRASGQHLASDSNVLTPPAFPAPPWLSVPVVGANLLVGRETGDAVASDGTRRKRAFGASQVSRMQIGDAQRRVSEDDGVAERLQVAQRVLRGTAIPLLITDHVQRRRRGAHVTPVDDQVEVAVVTALTAGQRVDSPAAHHEDRDVGALEGGERLDRARGVHRRVLVDDPRQPDLKPSRQGQPPDADRKQLPEPAPRTFVISHFEHLTSDAQSKVRWMFLRGLVNTIGASPLMPRRARRALLRAYGLRIRTSAVMDGCHFGGHDIEIGPMTFVNVGCVFDNSATIKIGEQVQVGMEVMFVTSTHALGGAERRGREVIGAPIEIGDGCWLGSRVTVLPGVTVGRGCVVAAGAVLREDCEPNGLYAGVPARRVKSLD